MRRLLTLRHFHGVAAVFGEMRQQTFQPLRGQIVTAGMRHHRLTARLMNRINGLFYCTPLRRHVAGFALGGIS